MASYSLQNLDVLSGTRQGGYKVIKDKDLTKRRVDVFQQHRNKEGKSGMKTHAGGSADKEGQL